MFGFKNARFKETLWLNLLRGAAAGGVIAKIVGSSLFVGNDKVGEFAKW